MSMNTTSTRGKGYPLEPLLLVRRRREDAALRAASAAEEAARAAAAAQANAARTLEEYRGWRVQEVSRRYDAIMGRQLNREALRSFKAGLAALGQQEEHLLHLWEDAAEATRAAAAAAQAARVEAVQAGKATEKIAEHKKIWCTAARRAEERGEEASLEECATPRAAS